ncbi:MAG: diguanylate cyclase [Mycobacteriales bacterium]
MRAVLALTAVTYAAILPHDQLRTSLAWLIALSVGYVAVAFAIEAASWWFTGGFYRWLFWLTLGLDGAFLGATTYLAGGSTGAVRYLALVYVTVITLLGTVRTGLATAAWQTIVQAGFFIAQRQGALQGFGGSSGTHREWVRLGAFAVALWVLALGTAMLSAINQRELQRRREELDRLVDLGRDLENAEDAHTVGNLLLNALGDAFGFDRMALFEIQQDIPRLLTTCGLATSGDDPELDETSVVRAVAASRTTTRVKRIDETTDPWLAETMPDARDVIVIPLIADGVAGVLVAALGPWARGRSEQRIVAETERFAGHGAVALRSAELLSRVRQLAITDGLTQLANRRAFDRALDREIGRASRSDGRLSVLLIDIDNFKALNDEHGHITGDMVLRQISRALQRSVRSYDTVARYGGEEFAAVLPGCSAGLAFGLADRLRLAIQDAATDVKVTGSVGVATFPFDGTDAASLLRSADRALYASKRAGRNRVRSAEQARVELSDL